MGATKSARVYGPQDVIQIMPGGRVRIHPDAQRPLAAWIAAIAERYERQATLTLSGTTGRRRRIRQGQIDWAATMLDALSAIADSILETADVHAYIRARDAITRTLSAMQSPGE